MLVEVKQHKGALVCTLYFKLWVDSLPTYYTIHVQYYSSSSSGRIPVSYKQFWLTWTWTYCEEFQFRLSRNSEELSRNQNCILKLRFRSEHMIQCMVEWTLVHHGLVYVVDDENKLWLLLDRGFLPPVYTISHDCLNWNILTSTNIWQENVW